MRASVSSLWYKMCTYDLLTNMTSHTDGYKMFLHIVNMLCSTLTHSTNEDLNINRKGDPKSRTLSCTSDSTETQNPCVIKVILLVCLLILIFSNLLILFRHTDKKIFLMHGISFLRFRKEREFD